MKSLLLPLIACSTVACSTYSVEYEHVSHPLAGEPFGPKYEEDWLDQLNVCGERERSLNERTSAYVENCLGYSLTDGGFYGPELTGTVRIGIRYSTATHNALGGYKEACGDKPGMMGDDC